VGSYLPNAWGLYDMHGNVWEWCLDWFEVDLRENPVEDPVGATSGTRRSVRAGSFQTFAAGCRAAVRGSSLPASQSHDRGFRLAATLR